MTDSLAHPERHTVGEFCRFRRSGALFRELDPRLFLMHSIQNDEMSYGPHKVGPCALCDFRCELGLGLGGGLEHANFDQFMRLKCSADRKDGAVAKPFFSDVDKRRERVRETT